MKLLNPLIASAVILATSSIAFAATDSTTVEIQVTNDAFVNLTGSAVGSTNSFTTADIDAATVSLGTLGLDSNSSGNCDITFSSANGYKLNHSVSAATLVDYSVAYQAVTNSGTATNTVTTPCTTAASSLDLTSPAMPATIPAGLYTDTLTVTVVTQ